MMSSRSTGRPPLGTSAWPEYAGSSRNEVMRRIALAAQKHGLSMMRFAQLAGRDRRAIVNAFDAERPHRSTIEACCEALQLDATSRRALVDDMTERDVSGVIHLVAAAGLIERRDDLGNIPDDIIRKAARAFMLARNYLSEERDPYEAFLKVIAPVDYGVAERAFRLQAAYPERVLECLEMIHQRVPAASRFTFVDDNLVLAVLADYVGLDETSNQEPRTSALPVLKRLKAALGKAAAKKHSSGNKIRK